MVRWPTPEARVAGLDWARDLAPLDMAGQVELVARNVMAHRHPRAIVAGRSFGAWLLLNALLEADQVFPGTVVCIASVLGYGQSGGLGMIAPRARKFWEAADRRTMSPARDLILIHAEDDEHCPIERARMLSAQWGARLVSHSAGGHGLGKASSVAW